MFNLLYYYYTLTTIYYYTLTTIYYYTLTTIYYYTLTTIYYYTLLQSTLHTHYNLRVLLLYMYNRFCCLLLRWVQC